jgi:beta-glucosidase
LAVALAGGSLAYGAQPTQAPGVLETAHAALAFDAATEGMVLLENDGGLPITPGNVAVFGVGAYATVKGGTGSGDVNQRAQLEPGTNATTGVEYTGYNILSGLGDAGFTVVTNPDYLAAVKAAYAGAATGGGMWASINYAGLEQTLTAATVAPTAPASTALYVITRNAGEGNDRTATKGDYYITDQERANITLVAQTYQRVIVIINTGGQIDTTWYGEINAATAGPDGSQAVDGLLLMSQAGQSSGAALAAVLTGAANPSGRLVDTWAADYSYYPASATFSNNDGNNSTEVYGEGVYVGYRYFDSFYKTIAADPASVVSYPFGYGLSYTTFAITTQSVTATGTTVTVKAKVTNTGQVAGKDVVEVYYSAPAGALDKPYQELAGYGKTGLMAPGESQIVTITFNTVDMASYDAAKAAWVLEAGDYLIRVGDSSRHTSVAAKINLARGVVTEQLHSEEVDDQTTTDLVSDRANFYSYATEAAEVAAAPVVAVDPATVPCVNNASQYEQTVPVDSSSRYYTVDRSPIASVDAYIAAGGPWAGYAAKTGETLVTTPAAPGATLYDVANGRQSMASFVAGLSAEQLAAIVEGSSTVPTSTLAAPGAAGYTTTTLENLGIAGLVLPDGPAGLRITQAIRDAVTGTYTYQFSTAWPIGTMLAQTWNLDLIKAVGTAVGEEMVSFGGTLWLAPGMDIHRDPLNGRNFEYYSEDPFVSGMCATMMTLGVQSNAGVGVTLKHFAGNEQEANRSGANSVMSERSLREIYLKGFEMAVKAAQPMAVMSSYNLLNGTSTAGSYDLLTDILRGEWGFKGLVMTDWTEIGDVGIVAAMYAGNDLVEPGNDINQVLNAVTENPPALDLDGLPVMSTAAFFGPPTTTWSLNGFALAADGAATVTSAVVDASMVGQTPQSGSSTFDMATFTMSVTPNPAYTSVQEAYDKVQDVIANGTAYGLTADQAAAAAAGAISVTDVTTDAAGAVTAYKVQFKGSYPTANDLRLGDLQRSAMRILDTVMASAPFAELAAAQGASLPAGQTGPYSAKFALATYLTADAVTVTATSPKIDISTGGTAVKGAGPVTAGLVLLVGVATLVTVRRRVTR